MTIAGRCFCGDVTYSIESEPLGARACWCRDCQRFACGSATVNILFPVDAVHFTGPVKRIGGVADSGNRVERGFCPTCGTHMFSATIEPAGQPIRIRAGTLDNPDLLAPQATIWTASAPSWAVFDPNIPHYPKAAPAATPPR